MTFGNNNLLSQFLKKERINFMRMKLLMNIVNNAKNKMELFCYVLLEVNIMKVKTFQIYKAEV